MKKTSSKIIWKMSYVNSKSIKNLENVKGKNVNLEGSLNYIIQKGKKENSKFREIKKQLDYTSRTSAQMGDIIVYTQEGFVRNKVELNEQKNKMKVHEKKDNFCLYRQYISFNEKDTKELYKYYSEEELYRITSGKLKKYLVANSFTLENVEFNINFHTDTEHLHLHFDFWEKEPTKRKHRLNNECKVNIQKELEVSLFAFQKESLNNLIKQSKGAKQDFKKELNLDHYNPELVKSIKKIFKNEPSINKQSYLRNVKSIEFLEKIDELYSEMCDTKIISEYVESLQQEEEMYKEYYGNSESNYFSKNVSELEKEIKNTIFRELKEENKTEEKFEIKRDTPKMDRFLELNNKKNYKTKSRKDYSALREKAIYNKMKRDQKELENIKDSIFNNHGGIR